MHRKLSLAPMTALATLLATGAAGAAEWHYVREPAAARAVAQPLQSGRAAAEAYLKAEAGKLRIEGVDLQFRGDLAVGAHRAVRFAQTYKGLPVIGGAAAIRVAPDGGVNVAVLDVTRGLDVDTTPQIDEAAARAAAEAHLGMTLVRAPTIRLAVQPYLDTGRLVWTVHVLQGTHKAAEYLVDAHAGQIVGWRPVAHDALGRVYQISSVNTPSPVDVTLDNLDVANPQMLTGWNGNLVVTNYVSGTSMPPMPHYTVEQTVTPSSGEDFLYDPPVDNSDPTDAFAQVGIFYHMTRIRNYFTGFHAVDMSPASWKVTAIANLLENGQAFDNAFFAPDAQGVIDPPYDSPNMMGIGQGTMNDFAEDSDVFLHEFGHYVSHNAVGYNLGQFAATEYGISPWSGAIDEGIADYFACTLNGDPTLGEASLAPLNAERDLTDTTKVCPDHVLGEVHYDGEIIGSLSWSLRAAFTTEIGDRLVWGAVTTLTPGATMGDFARGLQQTAAELVTAGDLTAADVQTIDGLIADRGLNDCDEVLEVLGAEGPKPRTTNMLGLDLVGQLLGANCSLVRQVGVKMHSFFHFSGRAAATDQGIRFTVDLQPQGGNDLRWTIYARAGQNVVMGASGMEYIPTPKQFDYQSDTFAANTGELVIDAMSDPPFDPNQTYYVVIVDENCPPTVANVSAAGISDSGTGGAGGAGGSSGAGGDGPDADGDADESSGCGCRVAGEAGAPWSALAGLALGAAALARRQIRRRR